MKLRPLFPPRLLVPLLSAALSGYGLLVTGAEKGGKSGHGLDEGGVSAIDVVSDGHILHLLTAEKESGEAPAGLFHRVSRDGGVTWREAERVDRGSPPPFSPRRGMDPQIAAAGDRLVAAWTTAGTDRWGSGPIATAISGDGGVTWEPGPNPADDGLTSGHGFLDLIVDGAGIFHIVWLDSRDGRQGLRYTQSPDGGVGWAPNRTIQGVTCECCRNTLAIGPADTVGVLFRDHDPRDMKVSLLRRSDGQWSAPIPAGNFGWHFEGCPHVGGGIAMTGREGETLIHTLVWTGEEKTAGVHYVRLPEKPDLGAAAVPFGGSSATQPDLAAHSGGPVAAVWAEHEGSSSPLRYSLSGDHGTNWSEPKTIEAADPSATHPLVVPTPEGFRVFWTETPEGESSIWKSQSLETAQ